MFYITEFILPYFGNWVTSYGPIVGCAIAHKSWGDELHGLVWHNDGSYGVVHITTIESYHFPWCKPEEYFSEYIGENTLLSEAMAFHKGQ